MRHLKVQALTCKTSNDVKLKAKFQSPTKRQGIFKFTQQKWDFKLQYCKFDRNSSDCAKFMKDIAEISETIESFGHA